MNAKEAMYELQLSVSQAVDDNIEVKPDAYKSQTVDGYYKISWKRNVVYQDVSSVKSISFKVVAEYVYTDSKKSVVIPIGQIPKELSFSKNLPEA